ncbi:unnamed protein product [Mycena citricolor]|uniref:Lon protease homolog, mitochondrial n=1 Tax=Mycena citricolor TaxID=2018698 RepID=A0AAD2HJ59_9AGAR|nr:unnamed protein product [Mycena citricolor]
MNRLGQSLVSSWKVASASTRSSVSSRWRPTLASSSRVTLESRLFSSARPLSAQATRAVLYPRWINSKGPRDENDPAHPEEVGLEAPEDDSPAESSSSGSLPDSPSSSDSPPSSSDGDHSDQPPKAPPSPTPSQGTIAKQSVPENYPHVLALPIARRPLFPGFYKAVVVRNPQVVAAIKDMMKRGQPYLGAFLLKDENTDSDVITDIDAVHPVGVFAQITSVFSATAREGEEPEEGLTAVLYPHRRIKITELLQPGVEKVEVVPSDGESEAVAAPRKRRCRSQDRFRHDQYIRAFMAEIISVFKDIAQLNPMFRDQVTNFMMNQSSASIFDEPDKLADFAAAVSSGEVRELQDVLDSLEVTDRLRKSLLVLKKELINAQLQSKLARDVDSKIAKRQREYYLMEQLKGIKKELGMETDGKDRLLDKFRERAAALKMPEGVRKVFDEELSKLATLEPAASEANVTRNYLEWLTTIPWGQHSPENFSIGHAQTVLDADHYGLKDVKDRILEFLAVGKLRGTVQGKIVCLVGPPGVGKTSIGKSIARALNRQFFRFSVGGLTDVAEIKGHRRTYVGALPGKIIQALKRVGTENPLVLIDEVDKIGRGHNGDPSSALLEMLDPEQNNAFMDHYMDVPVDLSRVLFVCTANTLDTIPAPLLDRMEVLEVSGYVSEEKAQIANRYLGPQAKDASGLKEADVLIDEKAVDMLIKYYCRESGVRNLKKHIEKIYRKAALKLVKDLGEDVFPEPVVTASNTVESQDPPPANPTEAESGESEKPVTTVERKPLPIPESVHLRITPENLKDYVGPPVYQKDRMYVHASPPGVSTGLGYLGNGSGAIMPIEAISMPGKGGLQLTGKLGEVIRESAHISLSWVKSHAVELGITSAEGETFLDSRDIHVHMPEGSIGKEGPSAGTALLSAFVSLFTKTPINPDIAMTGEISLVGQVLPVGGLKEKILAAHRAGIKTILAPAANRADIEENVPDSVKEGIRFVYVEDVREVLHEVFRARAHVSVSHTLRYKRSYAVLAAEPKTDIQPKAHSFDSLRGKISKGTLDAITRNPMKLETMSSVQSEVLPLLPEIAEPYHPDSKVVRDLLVRAKTGTGKTLAFLVPAIEARLKSIEEYVSGNTDTGSVDLARTRFARRTVGTLVISPTRELATQIASEALKLTTHHDGFGVQLFVGGNSKRMQMRDWMKGRKDIVVATPGRLRDLLESEPDVRNAIAETNILILDEADTLLEMGFREDIEDIKRFLPPTPQRQTLLFSATVSKQIQQVARSSLAEDHRFINCVSEEASPVHAHISQYHTVLPSAEAQIPHILRLLAQDQLTNGANSKVILFLPTTKMTQLFTTIVKTLSATTLPASRNLRVFEIHSKRAQESRDKASQGFRQCKTASVLVTSDVSARGVDYPGVTRVIQVGIPGGREQYIHRVGRTGRGGSTEGRGDLVLLPWEIGFVTWQLTDIPLKPLTTSELVDDVTALAAEHDQKPSTGGRSGSAHPVAPMLDDIERTIQTFLPRLNEEAIKETFMSLIGYYLAKGPELRVAKSVLLQGCQDWSTGACGLSVPPYVSVGFLQKLGLDDGRTKRFGRARDDSRDRRSHDGPHWAGRGSTGGRYRSRDDSFGQLQDAVDPSEQHLDPREYRSERYKATGNGYRGQSHGQSSSEFRGGFGGRKSMGGEFGTGVGYKGGPRGVDFEGGRGYGNRSEGGRRYGDRNDGRSSYGSRDRGSRGGFGGDRENSGRGRRDSRRQDF